MFDVDLFVIGAGSGGVRAGRIAAGHGAKVMVAEEYRVGGTCVIRGCVPKKLYVYAGRFADEFEDAAGFGWTIPAPRFDFSALKAAKDKEIDRLEAAYRANLGRSGAEIVASRAVVEGPNAVRLLADGRVVTAAPHPGRDRRAPLSAGGHTGHSLAGTSNDVFEWEKLPRSVVIVGGGYIAVEFACALARMGSEVTIVIRRDKVLRGFDDDLRDELMAQLALAGIRVLSNSDLVVARRAARQHLGRRS